MFSLRDRDRLAAVEQHAAALEGAEADRGAHAAVERRRDLRGRQGMAARDAGRDAGGERELGARSEPRMGRQRLLHHDPHAVVEPGESRRERLDRSGGAL